MVGLLDRFVDWLGIASTLRRHLERREPLKVALRVGGDSIWMRSLIRWDELSLFQPRYPFVLSKGATQLEKWERGQDGVYRLDLERFPPNSARGSIQWGWPLAAWRQSRPHWLEG